MNKLDLEKELTQELLDEYFTNKEMAKKYEDRTSELSRHIKEILLKYNVGSIEKFGYSLTLKKRPQPNKKFVKLLLEENLLHLISLSISEKNLIKAFKLLGIKKTTDQKKLLTESTQNWLYIKSLKEN